MYHLLPNTTTVHFSHRRVSAMPVAGGKMQSDEIFQEIKRTVDTVSAIVTLPHG